MMADGKKVLVTGATGYVASWIVKRLLEEGHHVHATARNISQKNKTTHLQKLADESPGEISFFEADLLQEGAFEKAMKDCEIVFHTASPFITVVKDAQKDLIDPALLGTRNVLEQAKATPSVQRVVLTSSCAAMYTDAIDCQKGPNGELDESIWNDTASLDYQPYNYSKTLAEKAAWEIADTQDQWKLVTINPSLIFGPALAPEFSKSESLAIFKQLADGSLSTGVPRVGIGISDIRDVAEAHYQAGFKPNASGRNIVSGHNTNMLEMARLVHEKFGDQYKVPHSLAPKWLLYLVGPMVNKVITWKFVKNNVDVEWKANNSKSIKELDITYRPLEETLSDTFEQAIQQGIVKPK